MNNIGVNFNNNDCFYHLPNLKEPETDAAEDCVYYLPDMDEECEKENRKFSFNIKPLEIIDTQKKIEPTDLHSKSLKQVTDKNATLSVAVETLKKEPIEKPKQLQKLSKKAIKRMIYSTKSKTSSSQSSTPLLQFYPPMNHYVYPHYVHPQFQFRAQPLSVPYHLQSQMSPPPMHPSNIHPQFIGQPYHSCTNHNPNPAMRPPFNTNMTVSALTSDHGLFNQQKPKGVMEGRVDFDPKQWAVYTNPSQRTVYMHP